MYDLDCVDDQHSLGKSVGKYHMVNRVNGGHSKIHYLGENENKNLV